MNAAKLALKIVVVLIVLISTLLICLSIFFVASSPSMIRDLEKILALGELWWDLEKIQIGFKINRLLN